MGLRRTQTDFSRGETSPYLDGRLDVDLYYKGLPRINNFIPRIDGGLTRREGTRFISLTDGSYYRFIEFEFNSKQYAILLKPYKLSVYSDRVNLVSEISTNFDEESIKKISYSQNSEYLLIVTGDSIKKLERLSDVSWVLEDVVFEDGPYLDTNESDIYITLEESYDKSVLTIDSDPFVAGDVGKYVEFLEDGDYILAKVLEYTSASEVVVEIVDNILTEPDSRAKFSYSSPNLSVTNSIAVFDRYSVGNYIRISAGVWYKITTFTDTTEVVVEAALTMIGDGSQAEEKARLFERDIEINVEADDTLFYSNMVGIPIRAQFNYNIVWGRVKQVVDSKNIVIKAFAPIPRDVTDGSKLFNGGRTKKFRLGAWSSDYGYPKTVCFHKDRAIFYGTDLEPSVFRASVVNDFTKMSPTGSESEVTAENAITKQYSSLRIFNARFIISGKIIFLGTDKGILQVAPASLSDDITPENTRISLEDSFGAEKTRAEFIESAVIYVQKYGKKLRELYFDFSKQAYISNDLTLYASHLFENEKIKEIAYQSEPYSIIWVLTEEGNLYSSTYNRDIEKKAWARHNLGGTIHSICSIENTEKNREDLYLVISRTIGESTVTSVEVLSEDTFLDSASYENDNLDRFEGQKVWVVLNGKPYQEIVVNSGKVSLDPDLNYDTFQAGLFNEGYLDFNSPEIPLSSFSTTHGLIKRITELVVQVKDSLFFSVATNYREDQVGGVPLEDLSPEPYSTDHTVVVDGLAELRPKCSILHKYPAPLTILSTTISLEVTDK